ncbi:hypothetical protein CEXT_733441 [Caerostris extrusa]|uniref:Uncharacterized protein n=1 Tax=Caerostris extrusa TaxID=172846 RepID=A0AAV4NGH9_CAEEX|nr:hypothetical protein CEXT_733441 [Caerostris extrusa]
MCNVDELELWDGYPSLFCVTFFAQLIKMELPEKRVMRGAVAQDKCAPSIFRAGSRASDTWMNRGQLLLLAGGDEWSTPGKEWGAGRNEVKSTAPVQSECFHLLRALQLKLQPSACIDERGGIIFGSVNSRARRSGYSELFRSSVGGALNVGRCLRKPLSFAFLPLRTGFFENCH